MLIVDDSPMVQKIGKQMLEKEGYIVILASDGVEGVEKAKSEAPDLVLMDAEMPELDGWGALSSLKSNPDTKEIPVVICSGSEDDVMEKIQSLGGQGFLQKPYLLEDMRALVKEKIKK